MGMQFEPIAPRSTKWIVGMAVVLLLVVLGWDWAVKMIGLHDTPTLPVTKSDGLMRGKHIIEAVTKDGVAVKIEVSLYSIGLDPKDWPRVQNHVKTKTAQWTARQLYWRERSSLGLANMCYVDSITLPTEVMKQVIKEGRVP